MIQARPAPSRLALALAPLVALLACCGREGAPPATPLERAGLRVESVAFPYGVPSRLIRFAGPPGRLRASWVEGEPGGRSALRFARRDGPGWGAPATIASGERWFVNWADFPALAVLGDRSLLAHWLVLEGPGDYDYAVHLARSADDGSSWSEPVRLHDHAGPGEHGFVSYAPRDDGGCDAAWLDGRDAHEGGATALRARTIAADGSLGAELVLDERVCDCCPTAAARAGDGALLVAYRDRGDRELRDVAVLRRGREGEVETVFASGDGWTIAGCPVNGPALAVDAGRVAVAWYTEGRPGQRVWCAISRDNGRSFGGPIAIAGEAALGRVDAVYRPGGQLVVAWLEARGDAAVWRVALAGDDGRVLSTHDVLRAAAGRETGHARLAIDGERVLLGSTEEGPRVRIDALGWP